MAWHIDLEYSDRAVPYFEFDDELTKNSANFGFSSGFPKDPKHVPKSAHQTTKKKIHDIFSMPGLNAVSSRFRDIVESFEPGVHQFFPLRLFHKDGTPVEGDFFIFNCAVAVETVLVKPSGLKWVTDARGMPKVRMDQRKGWILSRPAIDGRHAWRGGRLRVPGVFVSDELHAALKEQKIKYFEEKHCEEVDEPWIAADNVQARIDWEHANPHMVADEEWRFYETLDGKTYLPHVRAQSNSGERD